MFLFLQIICYTDTLDDVTGPKKILITLYASVIPVETLSVCPEKTDLSSVCTVERCMAEYPQGQVHGEF